MLIYNQTLQYLEINTIRLFDPIPSPYLSFLTAGLIHNTTLQELMAPVPLPIDTNVKTFFTVLSNKTGNLIEIILNFKPTHLSYSYVEETTQQTMTLLFCEQGLPALTKLLQYHTTLKLLKTECGHFNRKLTIQPNWVEQVQQFFEAIYIHPTIEYAEIIVGRPPLPKSTTPVVTSFIKNTFEAQKEALIALNRQRQPHRPIPAVKISY